MPVPTPVVKPTSTKEIKQQSEANSKTTKTHASAKKVATAKKLSCDISSYPIDSPVKKSTQAKKKITCDKSTIEPRKKNLAKSPMPNMSTSGESCCAEPPKRLSAKNRTNGNEEPTKKAPSVKKVINSKETCSAQPRRRTLPKKTTENAVMKLSFASAHKSKEDCSSGWCSWDSDMSIDGSEGDIYDSDYNDDVSQGQLLKVLTKRAKKSKLIII